MKQSSQGFRYISQDLQTEGQVLTQINKFRCLGFTFSKNIRLEAEVDIQTSNVPKAFDGLRKRLALQRSLYRIKYAGYRAIVFSIVLQSAET